MPSFCPQSCHRALAGNRYDTLEEESECKQILVEALETKETSIKLAFQLPKVARRRSSASARTAGFLSRRREETADFVVAIVGGPDGDLRGPREEQLLGVDLSSICTHEAAFLHPDTEYTLRVVCTSLTSPFFEASGQTEVRTLPSSAAQFADCPLAEKDSGFHSMAKGIGSAQKAPAGGGPAAFWGPSPGLAVSSTGAVAAAQGPADDTSTVAPSEACPAGELGADCDGDSEDGAISDALGATQPRATPLAVIVGASPGNDRLAASTCVPPPHVDEQLVDGVEINEENGKRTMKCNLCAMLDCLKPGRVARAPSSELLVEQPVNDPPKRARPYRAPFPGRAVDPASVGLEQLEAQNRTLLRTQMDQRSLGREQSGFDYISY